MRYRTTAFDLPSNVFTDHEPRRARLRFGAIVRTLAALSAAQGTPMPARPPSDSEELLPTRRVNRIRRLLGKLPKPGKSRSHVRRR